MSLHPVDAVEIRCDGCSERFENDDFCFFLRDQVSEWMGDDWKLEDGKHYCCGWATPKSRLKAKRVSECWPPSWRDAIDEAPEARS